MSLLRRTPKLSKKKPRKPSAADIDEDNGNNDSFGLTDTRTMVHTEKSKGKQKKKLKDKEKGEEGKKEENESEHCEKPVLEVINEVLCKNYHVDVDTISEISSTSDYSYNRLEDTSEFSSKDSVFHDPITSTPRPPRRVKRISSVPGPVPEILPQLKKSHSLNRKSSTARFFKGIFKKNKSESHTSVVISDSDLSDSKTRVERTNSEATVDKLRRKSVSLRRKLSSLLSETSRPVGRSTSIRDFTKKSKSENVNLWSTSLQSLVENDITVSYNDLSLINYDVLNTCSYEERGPAPVGRQLYRSQSVSVQNVCEQQHVITKNNRHSVPCEVLDRYYYKSSLNLTCTSEAASLPTLHQLEGANNNASSPGTSHRYRRRVGTEDPQARFRNGTANSFRSSGCSKLRRTNACRQVKRDPTPTPVPDRNLKIARDTLNIDPQPPVSTENQQYEWRRLVGSIRRRVQRHGTSTTTETPETEPSHQPIRRKSSLTHHSKLDFFRREKSRDEPTDLEKSSNITNTTTITTSSSGASNSNSKKAPSGKDQQVPWAKQRCVGFDIGTETSRGLCDTKHVNTKIDKDKLFVKSSDSYNIKGVRKSDSVKPSKDTVKVQKSSNFSFRTNLSKSGSKTSSNSGGGAGGGGICGRLKEERHMNRDDFLKATMRIFLVVSPPVGKMQVRSRSLNHLDTLGQTYHQHQHQQVETVDGEGDIGSTVVLTADPTTTTVAAAAAAVVRDHCRSEPDCTMARAHQERLLTVPATDSPVPGTTDRTGSSGSDRIRTTTRRQMLSRSQVSSSEYFSVSFELGEDSSVVHGREEFLPATKGTSLAEALSKVCERRSIDISNCDIYIDGCRATAPYILNQETSALGGKTIRIAAKEASSKKTGTASNPATHNRKTSGSYRGKSSGLFFSSSTEDASSNVHSGSTSLLFQDGRPEYDQSKKQSKQRWSGFFGNNKDTRMESLSDILNQYSRHGVPDSVHAQSAVADEEALQALYSLEEDWRQLMDPSDLTERQQQQQTAIWELISTEVAYIKTLKVVTGLFLACLKSLQACNILTEIDTDKLFSNITEILDCNLAFWADYVLPAVVQMRTDREPLSPLAFYDGFVRMCETYRPYFRYCAEQARCQHYCRENHAHNEIFTAYLVWCETQKECNRLRLMDILVRPMQRLTKYGLLLKAIIKNTDDDDEKKGLCTMIKSVDDFVNSVNSSLKQKQDNERLRGIMLRIESYDAVDTKDDDIQSMVQKHSHLDLSQPMPGCPPDRKRHLLLEGDLKLKDSTTSKMEVHCFLLTDILLICKPSSKKGGALMRVIRPPYLVDRLILQELSRETPSLALVYLNEFKTATAAFILQNNDAKKLKTWVECIRKAQGLYEQAKQTPSLGLVRQLSASVLGDEFLDADYFDNSIDADTHSLQSLLPTRSPLATSSRASRVSSLAHSHSGSVEMNDQSSVGSANNQSRGVSIENENRTASISSDEGVQPLPADKSPVSQKNSLKQRLLLNTATGTGPRTLTPNTLSVQPYGNLGQSLPNLTLGSPNVGTLNQNTLLVPSTRNGQHLLSPNQRGISYPPPSPTRGNLRRGFAISQSKNPPLIKTGHVNSTIGSTSCTATAVSEPTNFDFDVPVIAGISPPDDLTDSFNRGQHRQAMMKRVYRSDNRRYHTAGVVDDIKKNDERDASILKRLSWNCGPCEQVTSTSTSSQQPLEDHTDT